MPIYDGTLEEYLTDDTSYEEKLRVFVKILDGVEAAHKMGITHRDIKAKNILVSKDGTHVVVADFGIARFIAEQMRHDAALFRPGDRLANFGYAAPEQLVAGEQANEATDIFALGLLLYRIFTGIVPRGANPRQISTVAPQYPYLDEIANAMIQNDRNSRPQSIADIKRWLIQRGRDFVELQKLDELKRRVISTRELSDPLVEDPINIVDSDWNNGELILNLNHPPNQGWIMTLRSLRSYGGVAQAQPMNVNFRGSEARIPAPEQVVEIAYNHARNWFRQTNAAYAANLAQKLHEEEESRRREFQDEIRQAEQRKAARARVLDRLARQPK